MYPWIALKCHNDHFDEQLAANDLRVPSPLFLNHIAAFAFLRFLQPAFERLDSCGATKYGGKQRTLPIRIQS